MRTWLLPLLAFACGATLLGQTPAVKKPDKKTLEEVRKHQLHNAIVLPSWTPALVSESGMLSAMDVAASKPLTPVPALQGFSLGFERGDHKIRELGIMPEGNTAKLILTDQDNNDPFTGEAHFALINSGFVQEESVVGAGQFEFPLKGKPKGPSVLVLSGFQFIRRVGTDANVRAVGVWLDEERGTCRVTLLDDNGPDFRGFENTIGATLAGGLIPYGIFMGSSLTIYDAATRIADHGKYRGYGVKVKYAWVSPDLFDGKDQLTGTSPRPSSGKSFGGPIALTGFEFYFLNSDHHLQNIGVFDPAFQASRGNNEHVIYKDDNLDDPIKWAVAYRKLKPSAMKP